MPAAQAAEMAGPATGAAAISRLGAEAARPVAGTAGPVAETAAVLDPGPAAVVPAPVESAGASPRPGARPIRTGPPPAGRPARPAARPTSGAGAGGDDQSERGLRGLVGSGSSQVSVGAALRARDAARPTDEQFAEAEAELVIVRRNWMPREDLPRNR